MPMRSSATICWSSSVPHTLHLDAVSKTYGATTAVDRVSLDVSRGRFLTLLGPSGSGKTTLLMMTAGFVTPSAGGIRLGDAAIGALPPERRNFGMVFQGYALFPQEALSMSDEIAILRDGRLVQRGAPQLLYERPASRFVAG